LSLKLIDIDRLEPVENHIHYIKEYEGSAILMNPRSEISRYKIKFSIEHKPIGEPVIEVKFLDDPDSQVVKIIDKIKQKIHNMNDSGILSSLY